eukprot:jgi/Mesen1/8762/ME000524S08056
MTSTSFCIRSLRPAFYICLALSFSLFGTTVCGLSVDAQASTPQNESTYLLLSRGRTDEIRPFDLFSFFKADAVAVGPESRLEWNLKTIFSLVLTFACALLANSAGVGGGPLYMPLFHSVLGFGIATATALSHTVVACSAVASTVYGLLQRSPVDGDDPLIDFGLALTFIPPLLVGVGFGVLFNVLFPDWLQTLGLVLLLAFVIRKTGSKARRTWAAESAERRQGGQQQASKESAGSPEDEPLLPPGDAESNPPHPAADAPGSQPQEPPPPGQAAAPPQGGAHPKGPIHHPGRASKPPQAKQAGPQEDRGAAGQEGQGEGEGEEDGEEEYKLKNLVQDLVEDVDEGLEHIQQLKGAPSELDSGIRTMLQSSSSSESPQGASWKLIKVVGVMAAAGATAGTLGIGGALIFNPFLLAMGVHPQVTASTAVMMILFSSSSISLSFAFQGLLNTSYAALFAPVAFVGSSIGVTVIGRLVKRTGRASIIIIILTALIAVGTVLTVIQGASESYRDIKTGADLGFHNICTSK